jgi:RND family efflux transporter MFP subunit
MKKLIVAAVMLLPGCGGTQTATEPVRPVITQKVAVGASATREVYSGEIRARYETDLGFRVAGKIQTRAVDAGSRVKQGQVLARLDPVDAHLVAEAAKSQVASADADLALAQAELDRSAELLSKKFISQSAFDTKQNIFAAARARADQMKSQAAVSANQATYTTLVADADGVVLSVSAEPGQVVAAGQPVLKLARSGEKEVVINAPEGQLARFKVGEEVGLALWSEPARVFRGRIREVAGGADPVTRTYTVKVSALDAPPSAQFGMTANVIFRPASDAALVLLPLTAIAGERDAPAVWVVDPKTNAVQPRRVKLGQFREDGATVTEGLASGDVVVTAGVHKLRAGQVVRVTESLAPAPTQVGLAQ